MIDFALPDRTKTLGADARHFAKDRLAKDIAQRDKRGAVHPDDWQGLWHACAQHGLFGLTMPQEFGGKAYDIQTAVHILQETGYGCSDAGLTLGLSAQLWSMQMPILEFGTEAQKHHYLPPLIKSEMICAHAVTEDQSGSDAMALKTTATKTDDGYILNGCKTYIGMAPVCDVAFVFATLNPDHGAWGVSAFLVDANTPGFKRGAQMGKMGTRTLPFGTLQFENCHVPKTAILGKEGSGNAIFNRSLEWERRFIFAPQLGAMRHQLDTCAAFARERRVFGKPISNHQSVANRLADMKLRLETAQLMLLKAAWEADEGQFDMASAAATKLHISETCLANAEDAMRIMGAAGYLEDSDVARAMRDALGGITYGGTSDIQRQIISADLTRT